ncbi:alpha/beta-hydrolase [Coniochaeta ligniaria NRRL 30616]|uniref:Alpha/beta-hydrolase n=1 Tax=Coniochaeta ligniaria NRRL 30616 TaxID=1408157 RepID=A0A1J7JHI9_9PEZI|nr:alpha/beta-hydrolase [Coniochaeta ligniaria NRRL 30616]
MASPIKPFEIAVPDSAIKRLKDKLELTTWPDEVSFSNDWNYGAPLADIKRLAQKWQSDFDWRAHERKLNALPQFTTTIAVSGFDDLQIHFLHQRSPNPHSIPLLFCHGWPGSFLEVLKLLPLLTVSGGSNHPTFHVVAPSLPNFAFSSAPTKPGFAIAQYAEVCHGLMQQLGYTRYATQGGDWGFAITRMMGVLYPSHCLASHLNFVQAAGAPKLTTDPLLYLRHSVSRYSKEEKAGMERSAWFQREGAGYNLEQSTKPSTVGFALADSPVALLAWVYEKLHDWTDEYPWTDDEVLEWVSVYQFSTAGPAASVRIYYENMHAKPEIRRRILEYNGEVKLGLSYFPKDLILVPRLWGRTLGPVVFERWHEDGGHFAAHERPEKLAGDLREMFGQGGGARSVVERLVSKL